MIKTESDCLNCGLPCRHELCPHYKVKRLYCDECKERQINCINTAKKNYVRTV